MTDQQPAAAAATIAGLLEQFRQGEDRFHDDQREQWRLQQRKEKLSSLCAWVSPCDGEVPGHLRNYLYDIPMILV